MKKYLIDQDQMTYLLRILRCYPLMHEELKKLKPIEPLTTDVITSIWGSDAIKGTSFGYGPFARAIEAHIIGEKQ